MGFITKTIKYGFLGATLIGSFVIYDALDVNDNIAKRLDCDTYFEYVIPKRAASVVDNYHVLKSKKLTSLLREEFKDPKYRNLLLEMGSRYKHDEEFVLGFYKQLPADVKNSIAKAYVKDLYDNSAKKLKKIFEGGKDE